tara:strand:- start:65 stop:370 length:306 start_codon:yes stop_codon:yes gene_type:complete
LLDADFNSWEKAWDVSNEFTLNNAAKVLFLLGAISEAEQRDISAFNRVRNNAVHKMFYDPYDEHWKGVSKKEITEAFQKGLRLAAEIEFKSGEVNAKSNSL